MGSSPSKGRGGFPVMKYRYIVPLDPAYLPTAGEQGGACGALAGHRKTEYSHKDIGAIESFLVPWYEIWNV